MPHANDSPRQTASSTLLLAGAEVIRGFGPVPRIRWSFRLRAADAPEYALTIATSDRSTLLLDVQWQCGLDDGAGWPVDDPGLETEVTSRIGEELVRIKLARDLIPRDRARSLA